MSLQLNSGQIPQPTASRYSAGRTVAATELRLRMQIGDLHDLLDALFVHTDDVLSTFGDVNLEAYRRRIAQVDSAYGDLESSVSRLSELIFVGADTLLITVGKSVCDTLARILESAQAHVAALEDGA